MFWHQLGTNVGLILLLSLLTVVTRRSNAYSDPTNPSVWDVEPTIGFEKISVSRYAGPQQRVFDRSSKPEDYPVHASMPNTYGELSVKEKPYERLPTHRPESLPYTGAARGCQEAEHPCDLRGRHGAGEWNRTCGLRNQVNKTPLPPNPCPINGKRRPERELADGLIALSCIGCDGSAVMRGTLTGTPDNSTRISPKHVDAPGGTLARLPSLPQQAYMGAACWIGIGMRRVCFGEKNKKGERWPPSGIGRHTRLFQDEHLALLLFC